MPVFAVFPKGSACDATVALLLLVVSSQIPVTAGYRQDLSSFARYCYSDRVTVTADWFRDETQDEITEHLKTCCHSDR